MTHLIYNAYDNCRCVVDVQSFFAMIARAICFTNTNCGCTPVVLLVVSPTTVYDSL